MTDPGDVTAADFAPLVNKHFRVVADDRPPFEVELIDVSESGAEGPTRTQFSLLFRGGPDSPLPQHIYGVEHERVGRLDIFLVPLGPDGVGQRYEAAFT